MPSYGRHDGMKRQLSGGCVPVSNSNLALPFMRPLPHKHGTFVYLPGTRLGLSALPADESVRGRSGMLIKLNPALDSAPNQGSFFILVLISRCPTMLCSELKL